ncbi:MAG: nucleoside-diphosphate kinase [Candidatus Omnitrophica bacterium]|nr:nucleoside-diphosphate kinase [Candidatus Omnitrophota bacterium]
MEKTLILLKSDALERGLAGVILARFEVANLRIVNLEYRLPSRSQMEQHYADLKERNPRAFQRNVRYMANKPVIAVVLAGANAVQKARALVGPTEPSSAPPGTIRGDFSSDTISLADAQNRSLFNLVHAADSVDSARNEIALWFSPEET